MREPGLPDMLRNQCQRCRRGGADHAGPNHSPCLRHAMASGGKKMHTRKKLNIMLTGGNCLKTETVQCASCAVVSDGACPITRASLPLLPYIVPAECKCTGFQAARCQMW